MNNNRKIIKTKDASVPGIYNTWYRSIYTIRRTSKTNDLTQMEQPNHRTKWTNKQSTNQSTDENSSLCVYVIYLPRGNYYSYIQPPPARIDDDRAVLRAIGGRYIYITYVDGNKKRTAQAI